MYNLCSSERLKAKTSAHNRVISFLKEKFICSEKVTKYFKSTCFEFSLKKSPTFKLERIGMLVSN